MPENAGVELTKVFTPEQYAVALESWAWIGLGECTPRFASLFGDVFLDDPSGWWYLDTIEGSLTRFWSSAEELRATLESEAGQDRYLLAGLAMGAHARGITLGPDEVYDLVPPPVLGGGFDLANVRVYDFVVATNLNGQLHRQVRDMPPGTKISEFRFEE